MSRGYACVALDRPKLAQNVGAAMRASYCYDVDLIVIGGQRFGGLQTISADTTRAWRHVPTQEFDDVFAGLPRDCVPVAVDLIEGARPLTTYTHPERAFYIFGAEDQTLGPRVTDRCRDIVYVPTRICMNLAATVNVVLYDRMLKRERDVKRLARATRRAA